MKKVDNFTSSVCTYKEYFSHLINTSFTDWWLARILPIQRSIHLPASELQPWILICKIKDSTELFDVPTSLFPKSNGSVAVVRKQTTVDDQKTWCVSAHLWSYFTVPPTRVHQILLTKIIWFQKAVYIGNSKDAWELKHKILLIYKFLPFKSVILG
jgi:hypothetical protein